MYILQHTVSLGQKRMERKEGRNQIVIYTTYTSISIIHLQKNVIQVLRSHLSCTFPPPATGCTQTGGRRTHQSIAMIQTRYSQTMQTDIIKYFIFIYIERDLFFIYYNLKIFMCSLYGKKQKTATPSVTSSMLNLLCCVGEFLQSVHRGLI